MKELSLKTQNAPLALAFVAWCTAVFVSFYSYSSFEKVESIFDIITTKNRMYYALLPMFVVMLSGLISPENKARLVFGRWKYALPGHRAFSELARHDPRINVNMLISRLGTLPESPKEQNSQWYSIYKSLSKNSIVLRSHRQFLLTRDLTAFSCLFLIFGTVAMVMLKTDTKAITFYMLAMLLHYIFFTISARNYGDRFVCNVLCEFLNDNDPKSKRSSSQSKA